MNNYKIYMHKNIINGKIYIGQTVQSLKHRWNNGMGYLSCPYFYRAIKKYGWDSFEHILIDENLTKDEANIKEAEYIKKYKSYLKEYGYNISHGGSGLTGAKKYINIYQYDMDGKFIKSFDSIRSILNENPTYDYSSIRHCCEEDCKSCYGFQWKLYYKDKIEPLEDYNSVRRGKSKKKRVYQYDMSGNFVKDFDSVKEAAMLLNTNANSIGKACLLKQKSHMGYQWRYEYSDSISSIDVFVICQYDIYGNFIASFNSAKEAFEKTGIVKSNIINCYNEKGESAGGYVWKKYNSNDNIPLTINPTFVHCKKVNLLSDDNKTIRTFRSISEAAKQLGLKDPNRIGKVCNGHLSKYRGYKFSFSK